MFSVKKIAESAVPSNTAPQVGEKVRIDADPKYEGKTTRVLSVPEYRDFPIIVVENQVFFGGSGATIHDELLRRTFAFNDWGPYWEYQGDIGYGYVLNDFLGQKAVILLNEGDTNHQLEIIRNQVPDAAVYLIENIDDENMTRLAKRLVKKQERFLF